MEAIRVPLLTIYSVNVSLVVTTCKIFPNIFAQDCVKHFVHGVLAFLRAKLGANYFFTKIKERTC